MHRDFERAPEYQIREDLWVNCLEIRSHDDLERHCREVYELVGRLLRLEYRMPAISDTFEVVDGVTKLKWICAVSVTNVKFPRLEE